MTKYRKSLLSVSAAIAIASVSLSANYIPLTKGGGVAGDDQWVILGVAGLQTDGTVATDAGEHSASVTPSTSANTVSDSAADELEGTGLTVTDGDLGQIKILSGQTVSTLEGRVDTTGIDFIQTDPVRTMYVDSSGDGAANFAFMYKASLEGKTLEYTISGGNANFAIIDSSRTFSNPAPGAIIAGVAAVTGNEMSSLTETNSLVDYNLTNNPPLAAGWSTSDRDAEGGSDTLRVYGYDAENERWDIFDSRNTDTTNDFTDIVSGKGYWARMDDGAANSSKESGLVLGTPNLTTTNYANAGLAEGWNFIAFDGQESDIRNSVTGMIVATTTTNGGTFTITDSTGDNTVTITNEGVGENSDILSRRINNAVENAKLLGTVPGTFELKAFPTAVADQIVLIANKKFTLKDGGAELANASSLTGNVLYNPSTKLVYGAVGDVDATGVMSKYGEYALVIEPLVGAGTAEALASNLAAINISGEQGTSTVALTTGSTLANTVTDIGGHADFTGVYGLATEVDVDINGTSDHVLMASVAPFYVRDNTFSRSFKVNDNSGGNTLLEVNGAGAFVIVDGANAATVATAIGTNAADDGAGNVVIINKTNAKFGVLESPQTAGSNADNLQFTTSTADIAKGAVKAVYSLNYLAKLDSKNVITLDIDAIPDDANDTFQFDINDTYGNVVTASTFKSNPLENLTADTGTDNDTFFDFLVRQIEADFLTDGIQATVTHDADTAADLNTAVITISGPDIATATYSRSDTNGTLGEANVTGTATLGYLADFTPDLSSDLKYNAVYSPDYVMDGPLYTMKENNMTLSALVTGTTNIANGDVSWESVDLTRDPSDWLDSQDYDLFDTSAVAGYWAKLTPTDGTNPLSIASAVLSAEYSNNFDYASATTTYNTTNHFSGNFEVSVSGLSDTATQQFSRVTATIEGETLELVKDTDGLFKASVSSFESYGWQYNTNTEVTITVADGLGNNLTKTYSTLTNDALFDNVAPAKPDVNITDGELVISSTDTSVAGFYVFDNMPPEKNPELPANYLSHLIGAGTASGGCEDQSASGWDADSASIVVVAVDGNGSIGYGNVSPATTVPFMPIMKGRALVTNTNNGSITTSTGGNLFDSSCVDTGALGVNTGVTVSAITNLTTTKLAYTSLGLNTNNDIPITAYVTNAAADTIAKITYPEEYAGTAAFIELDGEVNGLLLPTRATIETGGANSGVSTVQPYDVESADASNPKTDISL